MNYKQTSILGRLLRLAAVPAVLSAIAAGCGPSMTTIRAYVRTSPERTIAVMPFSIADHQTDVVGLCQNGVRDRLLAYGFNVLWNPALDRSSPVLGPHLAVPNADQVLAYGRGLKASVVLVGRIVRAQEQKPGKDAVYKDKKRSVPDGRGGTIQYTDRVLSQPEKPDTPADFQLELGLVRTDTGAVIWHVRVSNKIPSWPLADVAQSCAQDQISQLAEVYLNRKL